jgi:hypothetical protein
MSTQTKQLVKNEKNKKIILSEIDTKEIESTFSKASDFRSI